MLFVKLAGDHPELGLEEVLSIHRTLGFKAFLMEREDRFCLFKSKLNPVEIMKRAAYVKEAGHFLARYSRLEEVAKAFNLLGLSGTFKVDATGFPKGEKERVDREVGDMIEDLKPDMKKPDWIIRVDRAGWAWAVPNFRRPRWSDRFPRRRPFFHPSALKPRIARALVNLSCAKEVLIDPFVGTGSTLIEAGLLGIYGVGCDIDERMVKGCKRNLRHYGLLGDVIQADAKKLPFRVLKAVATDLPYGRASSTHGSKFEILLTEFLDEMKRLLKGRAAIMYPSEFRGMVPEEKGFDLYVHRSLMRRISVVRLE